MWHLTKMLQRPSKTASLARAHIAGICIQDPENPGWFDCRDLFARAVHVLGRPGCLINNLETLPTNSQPNSEQTHRLRHDIHLLAGSNRAGDSQFFSHRHSQYSLPWLLWSRTCYNTRNQSFVVTCDNRLILPGQSFMPLQTLWDEGGVVGECVSCNCISSLVIWTKFVFLGFLFSHCWDIGKGYA